MVSIVILGPNNCFGEEEIINHKDNRVNRA